MKKAISLITISFMLMFLAGCTIVQPVQQPTPTETVDVNKKQRPEAKESNPTQKVAKKSPITVNNKPVYQKKTNTQTATTPKPVDKVYRLKVTLTDIQSIVSLDRDNINDYGIQQYVVYKALGKEKEHISRDIRKFRVRIDLDGQVPDIKNMLINGGKSNQIHVRKEAQMDLRNRNMIRNSLVFQITSKELEDPNASFKIFTWLKEYSNKRTILGKVRNDVMVMKNESINVKIRDVIEILSGTKSLNESSAFPDYVVGKGVEFHKFGSGFMYLANIQKITPLVLEGPITDRNPNSSVAVWVQFELIN